ncbi:Hypoxia-inducible factor 1-alpha inhibitor [Lamellibrachia satsuma]|nr:Hypoxia-inducible factor 1-alpha inhibitor [Lamellibrachia satsuma]
MAPVLLLLAAFLSISFGDQRTAPEGECKDETCRHEDARTDDIWRGSSEGQEAVSHQPTFLGGDFFFKKRPIARFHYTDSRVFEAIAKQEPVALTGQRLFKTDVPFTFDYLRSRIATSPLPWTVLQSTTRVFNGGSLQASVCDSVFMFPHISTNFANYKVSGGLRRVAMNASEFYQICDEIELADNGSRVYVQNNLEDDLLGESVYRINWKLLRTMQDMFAWSKEHTHLVLLSQRDSLTSAHYDYDENIFQQIFGYKRFIFFHPDHYGHMYPHPIHHSKDRQTQANFDHPDFERFPKLRKLEGIEAVLGPGDLLYVPSLWWHMVETSSDGPSFSMAFRHLPKRLAYYSSFVQPLDYTARPRKDGAVVYRGDVSHYTDPYTGRDVSVSKPDNAIDMIHIRRQVEHLIAASTGSYRKVKDVLHDILDGRFDDLEFSDEDPLKLFVT